MKLTFTFSLILLLLTATAATTAATVSCSDKTAVTSADCTAEVVSFSACLPYTAMPPNNLTSSASSDCCSSFSGILTGNISCLCSLIREPPIFGFPLNYTRVVSLSSVCPLAPQHKNLTVFRNYSLKSFCSGAPPPLPNLVVREKENQSECNKFTSGAAAAPSSFHDTDSKPQTAGNIYLPPSLPRGFPIVSSATKIRKPWRWIMD